MVETSTGVGIGTSSPSAKLHVKSTDATQLVIERDGSSDQIAALILKDGSGDQNRISSSDSNLIFGTGSGNTERMKINSSGVTVSSGNLSMHSGGRIFVGNGGNAVNPMFANVSDTNTGIAFPSADTMLLSTGGSERLRIDSSGRLLIGASSARSNFFNTSTQTASFQVEGNDNNTATLSITANTTANANSPQLIFAKSAGSSVGSNTLVGSGVNVGRLVFSGNDGSEFVNAGEIRCQIDGTPGANDMPGRLVFSTTADGASSPTERMRIEHAGNVIFKNSSYVSFNDNGYIRTDSAGYLRLQMGSNGTMFTNSSNSEVARFTSSGYFKARDSSASYISSTSTSHELNHSHASANAVQLRATNTSYSGTVCNIFAVRAATSSYWLIRGLSSSGSASADDEFYIRGDGNAYADGSWNGGGADYAEYFEWSDGNTEAEDRRGISVVLDGDKIRQAVTGEEPIGVISGNPSVVGDADMTRWKGKYLRDDYGSYVLDEGGYRQLNPDYDSDTEYVSREDRPEWDTVGLMGKLRIRKGQVTGTRWIKMRDVSDTVEEWLVR